MKRNQYLCIILCLLILTSCNSNFELQEGIVSNELINSNRKTKEEVISQALQVLQKFENRSSLKCELIDLNAVTRSADSDSLKFYLVNTENNNGWAIVSGDKRATNVYAYSNKGNLKVSDMLSGNNSFINLFMVSAIEYCRNEIFSTYKMVPVPGPEDPRNYMKDVVDGVEYYVYNSGYHTIASKNPLIQTDWATTSPYNDCMDFYFNNSTNSFEYERGRLKAPHEAVSLAQIMNYYQTPTFFNNQTIDWTNSSTPSYIIGQIYINANGRQNEDNYGVYGSINFNNLYNSLSVFGYTSSIISDFNESAILLSLNTNMPVLVHAYDSDYHDIETTWIIDGYDKQLSERKMWYTYPPYNLYSYSSSYRTYFHCNWATYTDAYFLNTFNINAFKFNRNIKQITNIQPLL